jgi:hypothetical protein
VPGTDSATPVSAAGTPVPRRRIGGNRVPS